MFWYMLIQYCKLFSGQKLDFKILSFPPIINSLFCFYNFEKSSIRQFIQINSNFFPIDLLLLGSKLWQKTRLQVEIMKKQGEATGGVVIFPTSHTSILIPSLFSFVAYCSIFALLGVKALNIFSYYHHSYILPKTCIFFPSFY